MKTRNQLTEFAKVVQGFTLIEMIVALAIVATGISAAVGLVASMNLNASRIQEKAHAQWLMNNAIVEIQLTQRGAFTQSPLSSSAVTEMADREWHIFSQHSRQNQTGIAEIIQSTVTICTDEQRQGCVLEQVFSSANTSSRVF